ncbi:M16 family metallopeptidase [Longimicrobium sp.]|uniref:M16 family metallopeptidase n=1 Tax=Longimicrobium sp. TaxID=2029185 RepID=UPI003B3B2FD6
MTDATMLDRTRPPAPGPLRPFTFPRVQRRTLDNGLEVVVAENHAFPIATLDLVLPSGGLGEPEERGGMASLTAGLLESGAGGRDATQMAEAVDELGLALETGISWDTTLAGFTALTSRLEAGMRILADMVIRPAFPRHEVERIRDERLAAVAQRRADPSTLADELNTWYSFPAGHPFGRRLGGMPATLATLTREDVAGYHATHYLPAGAWLCAAGDVTLDGVSALAERYFAGWTGAPAPAREPQTQPRFGETTIILADRPGSVQSEVRVGHLGIPRTSRDYFAVSVMNAILGGLFSSRLNLNLRERLGYTYGVSSAFGMRKLPGTFTVSAAIQSEGTAHSVSEVLRDMRLLQDELVSDAELSDARSYLAGTFPLALQTTDGLAGKLSSLAVYGLPDDYYDSYRDRLMAVTADEVREAARRHLMPDRAAVVVVGDAGELRGGLEALDIGPVQVVDPAEVLG